MLLVGLWGEAASLRVKAVLAAGKVGKGETAVWATDRLKAFVTFRRGRDGHFNSG